MLEKIEKKEKICQRNIFCPIVTTDFKLILNLGGYFG